MSNFFRVQLPYEKWYGLSGNEDFLASNPFYLSTDGLLIVAKDKTHIERELTVAEKIAFGCDEFENAIFVTTNNGKRGQVIKEKAMKINVKKKKRNPMNSGFEILIPEDKGKAEESKDVVNGDASMNVELPLNTNSTVDTAAIIDSSVMENNGGYVNGESNEHLNGNHVNRVTDDVNMHNNE